MYIKQLSFYMIWYVKEMYIWVIYMFPIYAIYALYDYHTQEF